VTLDVNKDKLTILGVQFDNFPDFDTVWYAIGSSMIENYEPTVQDVIDLKTYVVNRRKELNIGFLNTSSRLIALLPQKI
jgi:hypothetical protein